MKAPKKKDKPFQPFKPPKRPDTILKRAKRVIEDGEWTKGLEIEYNQDEEELSFCLLGALRLAMGEPMHYTDKWTPPERFVWGPHDGVDNYFDYHERADDDPLKMAVEAIVESISPQAHAKKGYRDDPLGVLTSYNDKSRRRKHEIIKLIDRAIEWLKS